MISKILSKTFEIFNGNTFTKHKKKFLLFTIFCLSGFFRDFLEIPGISGKSPGFGNFFYSRDFYPRDFHPRDSGFFLVSGFLSPGFGIFLNFGIFIPGIFAKSPGFMQNPRDFYPRDSGFFRDFWPSGYPGDFLSPGSGFFFVGWDIPTKSHLWCKGFKIL